MNQETIDKLRRIYKESTNAVAKEGAKKKLQDAGIPLTAEEPKKETQKKTEPKASKPKSEPTEKAKPTEKEEPSEPKKATKSADDTYCDELIAKEKERKAKAKASAEKRANAPKKTPSTKNKEAVEKTTTKVEKSVESRAKKGEVKVEELEKLIAEYQEAIKKLKALLVKVKSGKKYAEGGNMGMMNSEHAKEYHEIKEHSCGCDKKKMAKGGYVVADLEYNILGSFKTEEEAKKFAKQKAEETYEIYRYGEREKIERHAKEDGYMAKGGDIEHSTFKYHKVPNENLWAIQECDSDGENCVIIRTKKSESEAIKEVERLNSMGMSDYYARGGGVKARKSVEIDNHYSALKEGKRVSEKYAYVDIRGGGTYKRRNANQYGKTKGGNTYYEHHENRVDSKRFLAEGGKVGVSHYVVDGNVYLDYMDAYDYCKKNKIAISKIKKTKRYPNS